MAATTVRLGLLEAGAEMLEGAVRGDLASHGPATTATFDRDAGCMTFPVAATGPKLRRIAIEVTSNHGREELTCLYRFMVHGSV